MQLAPNLGDWREMLEIGIIHFGATHPDIWLMLINFEMTQGEPINVSKVTERAKHTLKPDRLDTFLADRELQQLQLVCIK